MQIISIFNRNMLIYLKEDKNQIYVDEINNIITDEIRTKNHKRELLYKLIDEFINDIIIIKPR